jgi:NADPH-dependent 2,4-dienoyl-CoA reductase/sulfur reductase-like enzyme/rhodanese-related sulfurtransferase
MAKSGLRILVIGGVACGPKAASRLKRILPDADVTVIEKGDTVSYGACGLPYYVEGVFTEIDTLTETPVGVKRTPVFFEKVKGVKMITRTEAVSIDRKRRSVRVISLDSGEENDLSYDKLVIATGGYPFRPSIPGLDLKNIWFMRSLDDADGVVRELEAQKLRRVVLVGAGFIGIELAEAFVTRGLDVTLTEMEDQVMPGVLDKDIATFFAKHLRQNGVKLVLGERVVSMDGNERVTSVDTDKRRIPADLVILGVGTRPNDKLARDAGLKCMDRGGIIVNEYCQTSDEDIYAGGDCVAVTDLITGKSAYFPSGSLANREGRVIGTNLAGGNAKFEGAVGTFIIKLFEISLANAGMSLKRAQSEGFDALSVFVVQFDRAHFYPEKDLVYLELVVEKGTGRVLGIQGLGSMSHSMFARVNAVAATLKYRPTTADISNLELLYAPPFSSAMDILNALGNTAENTLQGKNRVIDADQFVDWWLDRDSGETIFLDCRGWGNAEYFVNKYPDHWKSIPQDELRVRMEEVPKEKRMVLICNTGVRSYEAQVTLDQMGIRDTYNLQGGVAALKKWGLDL